MVPRAQPAWQMYKEQMDALCYGDALWEPAPDSRDTRVQIGDVGFIREGGFNLLFSAGSPLGERIRGEDVPNTFEPLTVGTSASRQPRRPGCVGAHTVQQVGTSVGATVTTVMPLEADADFSFELTGDRGAALATRHSTYKEDSRLDSAFRKYTARHYKSWVKFARDKQYGENLRPVLVSGFDMTSDFAMATYSNEGISVQSDTTLSIPMFGSSTATFYGSWRTKRTPHTNHGPQQCRPPSRTRPLSPQSGGTESLPIEFSQCVFVRYYTMRFRIFPRVIRAGAGPHDLGSGESREDAFPELTARIDAESTDDDGNLEGLWDYTPGENSPELGVVAHNTQHDEECDNWDAIANYVFQCSNATSVLMHHQDIVGIREVGGEGNIPALLETHKPRIAVDEGGVGRVIFGEDSTPTPSPDYPVLQKLRDLGQSLSEFPDRLSNVLSGEEYVRCVSSLEGDDVRWLVDFLDEAFGGLPLSSAAFHKCLGELIGICESRGILPTSLCLSSTSKLDINPMHSYGGVGDVYKGTLDGSPVCVKRVRPNSQGNSAEFLKSFCREAVLWGHLKHPNIVPLLGTTITPLQFISAWMPGGQLSSYLENFNPDRLALLSDIAEGLCYLHSRDIIHGDLKGSNILVDDVGHARITDFALAMVTQDFHETGCTPGWAAPEVFDGGVRSKKTDIFSFAMVMVEVFTGEVPFSGKSTQVVKVDIMYGKRPHRPTHPSFTSKLWTLRERCWDQDPDLRPAAVEVLGILRGAEVGIENECGSDGIESESGQPTASGSKGITVIPRTGSQEQIRSTQEDNLRTWKALRSRSLESIDQQQVANLVNIEENVKIALQFRGEDAATVINAIDKLMKDDQLPYEIKSPALKLMRKLAGASRQVPKSYLIGRFTVESEFVGSGRFAYIRKGRLNGKDVAFKTIRLGGSENRVGSVHEAFCKECVVWMNSSHPNIHQLIAVEIKPDAREFSMISDFMKNGNIIIYIARNKANRVHLLMDIAMGLEYLHKLGIIHGDLKGPDVLINNETPPRACITDFGLSALAPNMSFFPIQGGGVGTLRYIAPESLSEGAQASKKADMYAFGMVVYEVITGTHPFGDRAQLEFILPPTRLPIPEDLGAAGFCQGTWEFAERCWDRFPGRRPLAGQAVEHFERAAKTSTVVNPGPTISVPKPVRPSRRGRS